MKSFECVTFPRMGSVMALRERSIQDQVVTLADEYAEALVASLPAIPSMEMLHKVVAGILLSFLADALSGVEHE